jgi:hypothetical protein
VTFSPNETAIFSSVARVGLPEPLSNSESMRGEILVTYLIYINTNLLITENKEKVHILIVNYSKPIVAGSGALDFQR